MKKTIARAVFGVIASATTKATGPPPRADSAAGSETALVPVIIGFTRLSFFACT